MGIGPPPEAEYWKHRYTTSQACGVVLANVINNKNTLAEEVYYERRKV